MKIIGLTGGVASGKNFVAEWFLKFGIPVFDADNEVHKIFASNRQILEEIRKIFPDAIEENQINRKKLGKIVLNHRGNLTILENLIHPLVREKENEFIRQSRIKGHKLVILNIPLLLEKKDYDRCDKIIVVITPKIIQKYRFIKRAKEKNKKESIINLASKFEQIAQNQLPNSQKKKLADFTIYNGLSKSFTFKQIKKIYQKLHD